MAAREVMTMAARGLAAAKGAKAEWPVTTAVRLAISRGIALNLHQARMAAKRVVARVPNCAANTSAASVAMGTVAGSSTSDALPMGASGVHRFPLMLHPKSQALGPQVREFGVFSKFLREHPSMLLVCDSTLPVATCGCV